MRRALRYLDPRQELFWRLLLLLSFAFRVYLLLDYRNPMNAIWSDPGRHWDNGKRFLNPSPMGSSNPYFYQLYLWLLQQLTHQNKTAIGIITSALSVSYPLLWYLFAKKLVNQRIHALRFATVLSWLPTHMSTFTFFMNESLMLPAAGAGLLLTWKAARRRSGKFFLLAVTVWVIAVLTRSIMIPIATVCCAWALYRQRRRILLGLAAALIVGVGFTAAAVHTHKQLQRYTPFADNDAVAIYFFSTAHDYQITYLKRGVYIYSSPTLYISPFDPFYKFPTARKGKFSFTIDPSKKGADVRAIVWKQAKLNWRKLPRMVLENLIYLSFSHSWPDSAKGSDKLATICLWERWIWFPIILTAFTRCILYIKRRGPKLVPNLTAFFTLVLYAAACGATMMEGRYRKPLEPLLLLALFWLWDAKSWQPGLRAWPPSGPGFWGSIFRRLRRAPRLPPGASSLPPG